MDEALMFKQDFWGKAFNVISQATFLTVGIAGMVPPNVLDPFILQFVNLLSTDTSIIQTLIDNQKVVNFGKPHLFRYESGFYFICDSEFTTDSGKVGRIHLIQDKRSLGDYFQVYCSQNTNRLLFVKLLRVEDLSTELLNQHLWSSLNNDYSF